MLWSDFSQAIKSGSFQSVYLFAGPEEYNKREALECLRRALLPAGLEQLNESILENCGAQAIIDSAETLPVMCDRRLVVVRDWAPLTSAKAKNEEADVSRMLEWLQTAPDSCALVFYMSIEIDARKKLTAALKKLEGYIEFPQLMGAALMKWCARMLKPQGKRISQAALDQLCLMAGQDLTRLSGELTKLAAYVQDAPEITPEAVRAVVAPSPEYSVFMILDHLLSGKLAEATRVVNSVLQTEPNVPRLLSLLAGQLRIDAHIKYSIETGGNLQETAAALNVNKGRLYHIQRQIRPISASALRERYLACVDAEYAIKSGRVYDRAALNALMLKLLLAK